MKKIFVSEPLFEGNELKYLKECIKTSWISSGKYIKQFENNFSKFCDVKYAITTSNGTNALDTALLALGIKEGDEVIVPDLTYVSTANTVVHVGAKPVFVDVDKDTWTIDPEKIEQKITKKTKAIIVVHLFGHPADMDAINKIAKKHNLFVIEDACQAHGSLYKGKKIGSLGDIACFSFSGAKVITTGEGGMVVSKNKKLIDKAYDIKTNYTSKKHKFYHTQVGHNFRFTNLQAAVGVAQLERIDQLIEMKITNAKYYIKQLKELETFIQLPDEKIWAKNTYWLFSIVIKRPNFRDKLINYLADNSIETRPFFVPMNELPMFNDADKYSTAKYLSENGICLPSGVTLKKKEIEFIVTKIKNFFSSHD
ncbi:DegT/DnrJ/EryC1/StrS family aminotransferase [Candidatus Roizmanbacteria bacterium]|nr:DegT/DnrJ/EryC1/StrS family aminotransferase [Candidatus Roizmanbacteria bacterium]